MGVFLNRVDGLTFVDDCDDMVKLLDTRPSFGFCENGVWLADSIIMALTAALRFINLIRPDVLNFLANGRLSVKNLSF